MKATCEGGLLVPGTDWGPKLPPPLSDAQNIVVQLILELEDIMDGISDLSVSEAVFQVMRGNFERAGGLLDAVTKGTYAPQPQVIDTQRSGIDLTHRVMALFGAAPVAAPGWSEVSAHARARMEPLLDAWAGTLLPDPRRVRCTVSFTDTIGTTAKQLALADLDVGPLDFLTFADADNTPQRSELEERIRFHAALTPNVDAISITFARAGLPPDSITFPEALLAARTIRALIGSSRPVQPNDLCEPQVSAANAGGGFLLDELHARLAGALAAFDADASALQTALTGLPGAPDPLRSALFACSSYGIGNAIPATSSGPDASLAVRANAVLAEMARRRNASAALPNATVDDGIAIAKALFAGTVVVLPRLTAPNSSVLHAAFAASATLIPAADRDAPSTWIQQLTHVRPGISRLDAALTVAELLHGFSSTLTFAQLPLASKDRWLGLPIDSSSPPRSGRVALAALAFGDLSAAADYAGLLFDEWPERIPTLKQSAAVSFHCDEPKSRAPQALLLAVCPDGRRSWDDELLLATLQETLQLAKIRTVDLDSIIGLGQVLPALYVPMNLQQATIATRFRMTAAEVSTHNDH